MNVPRDQSDTNPPDRRAVAVAGYQGDEATARAGLTSPEPAVRATAIGALERLARLGDAELALALADPDARVRRRACVAAATHPAVDLVPVLGDAEHLVAEVAAWALGERPPPHPPEVVPALSAMATGHDDPLCREAAVAALGAIGDPDGLPAILAGTRDKPAVRRRAVLALAPFEGEEVEATLRRALEDRDWQVRQAAEDLLEE